MQSKLNNTILIAGDQTVDLPERGTAALLVRQIEIRMVDEIQHLRAELQILPFADAKALQYREVRVDRAWTVAIGSPGIAECIKRRLGERGGVEPLRQL